jgi:nucleotide-binding universal stress UspA family protein
MPAEWFVQQEPTMDAIESTSREVRTGPEHTPDNNTGFKTLLVPVDLADPETARPAIARAAVMAHASNGSVRLMYVQPTLPFSFIGLAPPLVDEAHTVAERRLEALATGVSQPRVSSTVRIGSVYNEVLDEAERIGADLIIVGSHKPGMATYLLGSNAATIVRYSKCSVLVVR